MTSLSRHCPVPVDRVIHVHWLANETGLCIWENSKLFFSQNFVGSHWPACETDNSRHFCVIQAAAELNTFTHTYFGPKILGQIRPLVVSGHWANLGTRIIASTLSAFVRFDALVYGTRVWDGQTAPWMMHTPWTMHCSVQKLVQSRGS